MITHPDKPGFPVQIHFIRVKQTTRLQIHFETLLVESIIFGLQIRETVFSPDSQTAENFQVSVDHCRDIQDFVSNLVLLLLRGRPSGAPAVSRFIGSPNDRRRRRQL